MLIYVKYIAATSRRGAKLRCTRIGSDAARQSYPPHEIDDAARRYADTIESDTRHTARVVAQDAHGWYVLCEGVNHA